MLILILIVGVFGSVSYCRNAINYHEVDICSVESSWGFYLTSQIGIISDVQHDVDCLLLCARHKDCSTGSVVRVGPKRHYCVLHSSYSRKKYQLAEMVFEDSLYFVLHCFSKYSLDKAAPKIDPGKPGDHCGEPFFAMNSPLSGIKSKRILNGIDFAPFSQPWMGVVTADKSQVCGASLISKRNTNTYTNWALSAAHCFVNAEMMVLPRLKFEFLFGLHDTRFVVPYTIHRRPTRIVMHSQVNYIRNDIALIYFTDKIRFNYYIRPICLPGWSGRDVDVTKCSSCGWGITSVSTSGDSTELRCFIDSLHSEVTHGDSVDSVPNLDSATSVLRLGFFQWPRFDMGFSYGDSGGPVSCPYTESAGQVRYVLYGINSAVYHAPEQQNQYVCFNYVTLTSHYLRWIEDKMNGRQDTIRRMKVCSNWRVFSCYFVEEFV